MEGYSQINSIIDTFGKEQQHIVAIEELSELQKEITKWLRGEDNRDHLQEEIADVLLMIDQIIAMHGFELKNILAIQEEKISRTVNRMEEQKNGNKVWN